jgi:hypothetical protein
MGCQVFILLPPIVLSPLDSGRNNRRNKLKAPCGALFGVKGVRRGSGGNLLIALGKEVCKGSSHDLPVDVVFHDGAAATLKLNEHRIRIIRRGERGKLTLTLVNHRERLEHCAFSLCS